MIFFARLGKQLEELRVTARIPQGKLCADSHVSTSTYSKIVTKKAIVKPECYFRLLCGICKGATYEEFMEFSGKFAEWFYWKSCED